LTNARAVTEGAEVQGETRGSGVLTERLPGVLGCTGTEAASRPAAARARRPPAERHESRAIRLQRRAPVHNLRRARSRRTRCA
jgi:hypothetical protein